jgi:hypothetical protein
MTYSQQVRAAPKKPNARFYGPWTTVHMSFGPTERCLFCKSRYYVDKLKTHKAICSLRPRRLTVEETVKIAVEAYPAANTNKALLVRLVWKIRDGYFSEHPRDRLTDPESIVKEFRKHRRASALRR